MKIEEKKLLQDLGRTSYGKVLKSYLDEELSLLKDLQTIDSWEEAKGRQYAEKIIKKLFSFMEEKKTGVKSKNPYV